MADARIKVVVDSSGAETGARKVSKSLNEISKSALQTTANTKKLDSGLKQTSAVATKTSTSLRGLGASLSYAKTMFAGFLTVATANELIQTGKNIETIQKRLQFLTGSTAEANKELERIQRTSEQFGLNFEQSALAYSSFVSAIKGTKVPIEDARRVFEGVSRASVELGLSVEDVKLIMLGFTQVISKGKLSMQELRQQIGERFPSFMKIASDSVGVTTGKFQEMVEKGLIPADVFIKLVGHEMQNTFKSNKEVDTLTAQINAFSNEMFLLKKTLLEDGVLDTMKDLATIFAQIIKLASDTWKELKLAPEWIQRDISVAIGSNSNLTRAERLERQKLEKQRLETRRRRRAGLSQEDYSSAMSSMIPTDMMDFGDEEKAKELIKKIGTTKLEETKKSDLDILAWKKKLSDIANNMQSKNAKKSKAIQSEMLGDFYSEWLDYGEQVNEAEKKRLEESRNMIQSWADQSLDAFTNFVMGAKTSFSDLADSIIRDLVRIQIKQGMQSLLPSIFGASPTAIAGATKTAMAEATTTATDLQSLVSSFGLPSGISLPKMSSSVYTPPTSQSISSVQVINNSGVNARTEETANADGSKNIKVIVDSIVNQSFAQGKYDKTMQGRFTGLNKKGSR